MLSLGNEGVRLGLVSIVEGEDVVVGVVVACAAMAGGFGWTLPLTIQEPLKGGIVSGGGSRVFLDEGVLLRLMSISCRGGWDTASVLDMSPRTQKYKHQFIAWVCICMGVSRHTGCVCVKRRVPFVASGISSRPSSSTRSSCCRLYLKLASKAKPLPRLLCEHAKQAETESYMRSDRSSQQQSRSIQNHPRHNWP